MSRSLSPRRAATAMLLIAALLVAAACEAEDGSDTGGDTATAGTGGDTGSTASYPNYPKVVLTAAEQIGYDATMFELLGSDGLSGTLGQFWPTGVASVASGVPYGPPSSVVAYEGRGQSSACGLLSVENAWYCPGDEGIYYDDNFFRTLYRAMGPAAPTIVLAHEWGHHIQNDVLTTPAISARAELQADCLAGMYAGLAYASEAEEADLQAGGPILFFLGDRDFSAAEWFAKNLHGPPSWRAKAFSDGMLGDGAYCRDYADWQDAVTEPLGTYRWLPAPGMAITRDGDALLASLRDNDAVLGPIQTPPAGTTAMGHIATVLQGRYGSLVTAVGPAVDVPTGGASGGSGGIIGGTGAVQAYQTTGASGVYHGVLFLHIATTGEAATVDVFAPGPAPDATFTDPTWLTMVNYLFVVAFSLCPPDGAGTFCIDVGGA